jgi:F-type H+-transporting ATPase subunit epsilon
MSYLLRLMTPTKSIEQNVDSLRSEDDSGSFGVLEGHEDFMTVLKPSVLIYRVGEREGYAAVDGGIMRIIGGEVTVASRELVEGDDPDELKDRVMSEFYKKAQKEAAFMDLLDNMERLLVDRLVKFEKG